MDTGLWAGAGQQLPEALGFALKEHRLSADLLAFLSSDGPFMGLAVIWLGPVGEMWLLESYLQF